jgi:hypothetical protein
VGSGATVRIKRSVKVRVIRELESYPSVINEMKPESISEMLVQYIEIITEKGNYQEVKEVAEKMKQIEIILNSLDLENKSEIAKRYYLSVGQSYLHLKEYIKAYKCIRYVTSPQEI